MRSARAAHCPPTISACLRLRDAGHSLYAEKRTSGSATIRGNRLRENPRLSDDGIRGNPPLHYDVASDAGVGAKSDAPGSDSKRWARRNSRYGDTSSTAVWYTNSTG